MKILEIQPNQTCDIQKLNFTLIIISNQIHPNMLLRRTKSLIAKTIFDPYTFKAAFCCSSKVNDCIRHTAEVAYITLKTIETGQNYLLTPNLGLQPKAIQKLSQEKEQSKVKEFALKPLAQKVKYVLECAKKYQLFPKDSISQIHQMFDEGIILNGAIFKQQRFTYALNKKTNRFVYSPNRIITKQIFTLISQGNSQWFQSQALRGYPGISKSVSVSLYWLLAQKIDAYRFMKSKSPSSIIKPEIPKVVYWSIEDLDNYITVSKKIMDQCPELKEQNYNIDFLQSGRHILQFYLQKKKELGSRPVLIIDQIQSVASWHRRQKYLESLKTQAKVKKQIFPKELEEQLNTLKLKNYQFKVMLEKLALLFRNIIYLSSMNIEKDFIGELKLGGGGRKGELSIKEINFVGKTYTYQNLVELAHYFMFQFEQKILKDMKEHKLTKDSLARIEKQCLDYLQKKNYRFFITLLQIRQFVMSEKDKFQFVKQGQTENIMLQVVKKFQQMVEQCTLNTTEQIRKGLKKKDEHDSIRYSTIYKLYVHTINKIALYEKFQQSNSQIQDNIKQKNQNILEKYPTFNEIPLSELKVEKDIAHRIIDHKFLILDKKDVRFRIPFQVMKIALEPLMYTVMDQLVHQELEVLKQSLYDSCYGYPFQKLLIDILKAGKTNFSFQFIDQKKSPQKPNRMMYRFSDIKKGAYSMKSITSIKQQKKQVSVIQYMIPRFKHMISEGIQNAVFLPVKKKYLNYGQIEEDVDDDKIRHNHTGIDLVIAQNKVLSGIKMIQLFAIDTTIQDKNPSQKIVKFLNAFNILSDKDKFATSFELNKDESIELKLNYFVFTAKNHNLNLKDTLKKEVELGEFQFSCETGSNLWQIKPKKSLPLILKQVGYVNITQDAQILNKQQEKRIRLLHRIWKGLNQKK